MAMKPIDHFKQWQVTANRGIDGLKLVDDASINEIGDEEVVVELHAASLNFMDLFVARGGFPGMIPFQAEPGLIPGCDGSGIVRSVGSKVKSVNAGDKVVTHLIGHIPEDAKIDFSMVGPALGMGSNGTLTRFGVFHCTNLIHAPRNLSFEQAATLPCSGLTAYNALFGLASQKVKKGEWVLVQGTGGVSVAALQIAVAVGANVVGTTSSLEKMKKLRALGAKNVLNYREIPEWGPPARALTPDGLGYDHIIDIGGDATLKESVKAVKTDGLISTIGLVGGPTKEPVPMLAASHHSCIVRGIVAGTRLQFEDFVRFVDEKELEPALDEVSFGIEEVKEAYWRQEKQQHFSKVVIKLQA